MHTRRDLVIARRRWRRRSLHHAGHDLAAAEVQGPNRNPTEVQSRSVLESGRKLGIALPKLTQNRAVELEQPAFSDRRDPRKTRDAAQRTDLPEHVAGAQEADIAARLPLAGVLDQPPGLDDPPVIGALSLAHDHVAVVDLDLASAGDEQLEPGRVQLAEGRIGAQERADPLRTRLGAESGRCLGVCARQRERDRPLETQHAHRARSGPQGHRRRALLDQRPLTARLAWA